MVKAKVWRGDLSGRAGGPERIDWNPSSNQRSATTDVVDLVAVAEMIEA